MLCAHWGRLWAETFVSFPINDECKIKHKKKTVFVSADQSNLTDWRTKIKRSIDRRARCKHRWKTIYYMEKMIIATLSYNSDFFPRNSELKGLFTQKCKFCHHLPSCSSKPTWIHFFWWSQKKIFWIMLVTKQLLVAIDLHTKEKKYHGSQWLPAIVWLPLPTLIFVWTIPLISHNSDFFPRNSDFLQIMRCKLRIVRYKLIIVRKKVTITFLKFCGENRLPSRLL